jgi:hypothetical protein
MNDGSSDSGTGMIGIFAWGSRQTHINPYFTIVG